MADNTEETLSFKPISRQELQSLLRSTKMNARKRKVSEDEEDEFPYGPSKYRTLERDPLEEVVDMIANTKSCSFVWAKRIEYSELTEQIIVSHIFEQGLPLVCRLE